MRDLVQAFLILVASVGVLELPFVFAALVVGKRADQLARRDAWKWN